MKKNLLLVFFGILFCAPFFFMASSHYRANREALGEVGNTLVNAQQHHVAIVEGGARVLVAHHNVETIARATEYMSIFGSGTSVFQEIARIAAEAEQDCELLDSVLDLAARSTSDSRLILALAASACTAEGTADEANWLKSYEGMLARAEYPSVEAAIASQR